MIQCEPVLILEAADAQARLQAERDLSEHVGELLLYQLVAGERAVELHSANKKN